MRTIILAVILIVSGCATLPPNHDKFYQALQTTCTPTVITLPAPNGGTYQIPVDAGQGEACAKGMSTAFMMNQSGWERFGVAAVNMVGNVGVTAAPWFAAGYMAHEGFKSAGDDANGSYNTANHSEANPVDSSNRSTNNPNNSTNNSNNPINNSNQGNPVDNSDNRTNYNNPVSSVPEVQP